MREFRGAVPQRERGYARPSGLSRNRLTPLRFLPFRWRFPMPKGTPAATPRQRPRVPCSGAPSNRTLAMSENRAYSRRRDTLPQRRASICKVRLHNG
ncbi:conserved hypothetical protein [Citreicella sp. SE45]|nr:conserved hypothetical protein [Citreicella sp. SE45]